MIAVFFASLPSRQLGAAYLLLEAALVLPLLRKIVQYLMKSTTTLQPDDGYPYGRLESAGEK
jgi:hypothetical protein